MHANMLQNVVLCRRVGGKLSGDDVVMECCLDHNVHLLRCFYHCHEMRRAVSTLAGAIPRPVLGVRCVQLPSRAATRTGSLWTPLKPYRFARGITTSSRLLQKHDASSSVENATDISHSHFLDSASPSSDFNPTQTPSAGTDTSALSQWQGKLSPTSSHLFKLLLPLPRSSHFKGGDRPPQPTAFLLHPSQPLSHLARLIVGSLPPQYRDCEISFLALTGQEKDIDSHLRNAEEAEGEGRQEGGPFLRERTGDGRWQEVSWSQSTDLSDFIKQACLNEKFKITIEPSSEGEGVTLEVSIPSFASRTTYLRHRLLKLTRELDEMTKKKKA